MVIRFIQKAKQHVKYKLDESLTAKNERNGEAHQTKMSVSIVKTGSSGGRGHYGREIPKVHII